MADRAEPVQQLIALTREIADADSLPPEEEHFQLAKMCLLDGTTDDGERSVIHAIGWEEVKHSLH